MSLIYNLVISAHIKKGRPLSLTLNSLWKNMSPSVISRFSFESCDGPPTNLPPPTHRPPNTPLTPLPLSLSLYWLIFCLDRENEITTIYLWLISGHMTYFWFFTESWNWSWVTCWRIYLFPIFEIVPKKNIYLFFQIAFLGVVIWHIWSFMVSRSILEWCDRFGSLSPSPFC